MTLPRELRDMILRNVLVTASPLKEISCRRSCAFWHDLRTDLTAQTDIIATCQQLRAEASEIFYAQNTFCCDCAAGVSETKMGSKIRKLAHARFYDEKHWLRHGWWFDHYNLRDYMKVKQLTIVLYQEDRHGKDPELFVRWLREFKDIRMWTTVSEKIKIVFETRFQIKHDVTKVLAEVQAALDAETELVKGRSVSEDRSESESSAELVD